MIDKRKISDKKGVASLQQKCVWDVEDDEGKHGPASLRMPMAVVSTFQNLGYLHSAAPALF